MVSDDEEQSEITFLKTLSKKQKKKLLMYVDKYLYNIYNIII